MREYAGRDLRSRNLNTMDLTGEFEYRYFATTRGDSRIAITIAKNPQTAKLGRTNRFLIDDDASPVKLAYTLTKPFKLTGIYGDEGVFKFVLQEINTTDDDNQDERIADYYKHYPQGYTSDSKPDMTIDPRRRQPGTGRQVWL